MAIGLASALMIGVGLGIGVAIDAWLHSSPIATLVGLGVRDRRRGGQHGAPGPQVPVAARPVAAPAGPSSGSARWLDGGMRDGQPVLAASRCPRSPPWPGGRSLVALRHGRVGPGPRRRGRLPARSASGSASGLALALGNFRLISRATVKAAASADENKRRPLAFNTLGRLGRHQRHRPGHHLLRRASSGFGTLHRPGRCSSSRCSPTSSCRCCATRSWATPPWARPLGDDEDDA